MTKKDLTKKIYSEEEIIGTTTEYFGGDSMAASTWASKYALKDNQGNIYENSPDQMHLRIAKEIVRIEQEKGYKNQLTEEKVYSLLKDFKYLVPGGSNMAGIGNNYQFTSLSNCFVIGNTSDSYGGIMATDEEQVQLMKRRGGVGTDLSHIRPKESSVLNSARTSTGIVPFAERYSNSTKEVAQGGRRGALMLSAHILHPDSEEFIDAKMENGKITGANMSIKVDDEFMRAVEIDDEYIQKFPIDSENPTTIKKIKAKTLWDKVIHNAWKSAEPGVLFWDTIIRESVPDCYADMGFKTISTNPCGEIPLCFYDSCRLLAINLFSYVEKPFTKEAIFNEDLFKEHVHYAQRLMDDIIDLELEKIDNILLKIESDPEEESMKLREKHLWKEIRKKAIEGRRMGFGITAEGDMLAAMGKPYGTPDATEFATNVHKMIAIETYKSSIELAKERGSFPIYDAEKEKDNPFIQRLKEADPQLYEEMVKHGRRNIACLTIAPTGTVSMMTQTTSGIEPVFSPTYLRRVKVNPGDKNVRVDEVDKEGQQWTHYNVFHHKFEDWLKIMEYDIEKVQKLPEKELKEIIKKSPYYKSTSNDVNWVEKVKMQGSIQKWVDHSISSTTNVPEDIEEDIVSQIYLTAWKSGCKGMTIYREGSRESILDSKKGSLEDKVQLVQRNVKPHPRLKIKPQAIKYGIKREHDHLHLIPTSDLYVDDENKKAYFLPDDNFHNRLFPGSATSASFTAEGILLSNAFRGIDPNYLELVQTFQSFSTDESEGMGPKKIKSLEHAIGIVLEDYFLRNGILDRDKTTGQLYQVIKKKDLRKIDPIKNEKEYNSIMSQVRVGDDEEIKASGQNGKLDFKFACKDCGGTNYHFEEGCKNPICSCGWFDVSKNCG